MVKQQLRAVASLVKSGISDGTFKEATVIMMRDANQMLESPQMQAIGLRTITALLDEFDGSGESSASAAYDDTCRVAFETSGTLRECLMQGLKLLGRISESPSAASKDLWPLVLGVIVRVLSWDFNSGRKQGKIAKFEMLDDMASVNYIRPSSSWSDLLLSDDLLGLLFKAHSVVRADEESNPNPNSNPNLTLERALLVTMILM